MFVIVMNDRLLSSSAVCKTCPMASQSGMPRWEKGRLRCGRPISPPDACTLKVCAQYECTMGFRIAKVSEQSV